MYTRKIFYCFHWGIEVYVRQEKRESMRQRHAYVLFPYWGQCILQAMISIVNDIWVCMADRVKQRLRKLHCTEEKMFVSSETRYLAFDKHLACDLPTAVRNSKVPPDESLTAKIKTPNLAISFASLCSDLKSLQRVFSKAMVFLLEPFVRMNSSR